MNKKDLYKLSEIVDKKLEKNETITDDIISSIKKHTYKNGFIGIAQINPIAGCVEYNAKKITNYIKYATKIGLDIIVFPELSLVGYPLEDTLGKFPIIAKNCSEWLNKMAKTTKNTTALVGFPEQGKNGKYYNSIGILKNGKIQDIIRKPFISNLYGFNDNKYFIEGESNKIFEGYGICIGENITNIDSYTNLKAIINIHSIPTIYESLNNIDFKFDVPIIHVNQVGAMDSVVFSGSSTAYDKNGKMFARAKAFDEQLLIVNTQLNIGKIYNKYTEVKRNSFSLDYEQKLEKIYKIAIMGIKDYFQKCGLKHAVIGLSGGLDSTVCAVLLADALGKDNVFGISMPSKITTDSSKNDAKVLANNLGIHFAEASIKDMVDASKLSFDKLFKNIEKGWDFRYKKSFTLDNIQARSRAMYLWGVSNEFESCIPIATSDKSEIYMGYATINGDMSGGYAPIADITKTELFALAKWLNKNRAEKNAIPESVILKRPGAELAIDPKTGKPLCAEDALMPYEFMDEVIWRIENNRETYNQLLETKFVFEKNNKITKKQKREWLDKFFKRMSSALYKWTILAPTVTIDKCSILNKNYKQPITSGKIDYKESFKI